MAQENRVLVPAENNGLKRKFIGAALNPLGKNNFGFAIELPEVDNYLKSENKEFFIDPNKAKLEEMDRVLDNSNELDVNFKNAVRRYLKSGNGHRLEIKYQDRARKTVRSISIVDKKGRKNGPERYYYEGNYPADEKIVYSYLKNNKDVGKSITFHPVTGEKSISINKKNGDHVSPTTSFDKNGRLLDVYDEEKGLVIYNGEPTFENKNKRFTEIKERLEKKLAKSNQSAPKTEAPKKKSSNRPLNGAVKSVIDSLKKVIRG